jgi:hypothetical protein
MADATVAVQTKCVPKARRVSQVNPAWNAASFRDETNTPRSAFVTARLARSWLACSNGNNHTLPYASQALISVNLIAMEGWPAYVDVTLIKALMR